MHKHKRLALGWLAVLVFAAGQASAEVAYVIEISVDGLGGTYLNKMFNGTAPGGPYAIPNFTRLKNEGASTLAAHIDNNNWETLPNHTSIITCRPRDGANGHNWTSNGDPALGQTIHSNKGSYVAGVFDVAHDNGLTTGMYANKSKFSLFDTYGSYTGGGSYNAVYGALDITGPDNGRDKVDTPYINTALGGIVVDTFIAQQKSASPNRFAFLHINEPDAYGHSTGWGSTTWYSQVVNVDTMLGKIFKLIEQDVPAMTGRTAIILTADHGNQDNPPTGADRYAVAFYVWGPGVAPGADLYSLNTGLRQPAASYPMTTYGGMQPIRNAEASNLALSLLGLGPIPSSTFNYAQDLRIWSDPAIKLTPTSLAKTVDWGIDPPAGTSFTIQNTGVGALDYTVESDATWAVTSTTSGSCSTETDTIDLVFTTASLAPGSYVATLPVASAQATNSPQTVTVNLTVAPAPGDFDGDQDVDQEDYGQLQACLSAGGILTGCAGADLNHSGGVDQVDVGVFFNCMQGPNVAPIPGCGG